MYRSLRGAVPAAAPTSSQRPSSDTRSEWYSVFSRPSPKTSWSPSGSVPSRWRQTRRWNAASPSGTASAASPPVVVGVAAGQPGQRAVAGAVDRPLDRLAAGHVHDEQGGLLVAALGQEVGQPLALQRRHPAVEGDGVVVGQGARVDQDPLGPVGLAHQQDRMLLVAAAALEEPAVAPSTGTVTSPAEQPLQPFPHRLPFGPPVHPLGQELVLGLLHASVSSASASSSHR